jgi:hypothetical protein
VHWEEHASVAEMTGSPSLDSRPEPNTSLPAPPRASAGHRVNHNLERPLNTGRSREHEQSASARWHGRIYRYVDTSRSSRDRRRLTTFRPFSTSLNRDGSSNSSSTPQAQGVGSLRRAQTKSGRAACPAAQRVVHRPRSARARSALRLRARTSNRVGTRCVLLLAVGSVQAVAGDVAGLLRLMGEMRDGNTARRVGEGGAVRVGRSSEMLKVEVWVISLLAVQSETDPFLGGLSARLGRKQHERAATVLKFGCGGGYTEIGNVYDVTEGKSTAFGSIYKPISAGRRGRSCAWHRQLGCPCKPEVGGPALCLNGHTLE